MAKYKTVVDKITLILILHNRHKNIDRLLEYYEAYDFPIIIADSSLEKHQFKKIKTNWQHIYTPGLFFTEKLEVVLDKVLTPYVLMCADDDFIIPKSILQCISFLEEHADYSIAQGLSIRYDKESLQTGKVEYGAIYKNKNSVEDNEPLQRLSNFFNPYRSVFYAVFRTNVLQQSFKGTGHIIKKLFLNEYITAFLPVLYGKYKELPVLYQVREHAKDSDDKTALNIDVLATEKQHENEMNVFTSLIAEKMSAILTISIDESMRIIKNIIQSFASEISEERNKISLKKRIGNLLTHLPLIGSWLIKINRSLENKNRLQAYFDIKTEKKEIENISDLLLKYNK